jgi:hypothetical protein
VDTDGTAFLGQPEEIRENVLHNTGLSYKFKRALVNGEVFHSVQYLKSSKRNSCNVMYMGDTNKILYGQIQCFYKLVTGNFVLIRRYKSKQKEIICDKTAGSISSRHFIVLEKQLSEEHLIHISKLKCKVLIMNVSGLDFAICANFSNSIEKD